MNIRHLSEAQILEACQTPTSDDGAHDLAAHLDTCAECRGRRASLAGLLDELRVAADADTDAAFPADRLARQRDRILARVDAVSRAGKVLVFPSAPSTAAPAAQGRNGARWVAAAAAAGLVAGLLGGHFSRELGSPAPREWRQTTSAVTVLQTAAEDELLGQVEVAYQGRGPAALRTLDALTPVAWDVR